eukprot:gene22411-biopygen11750
MPSTCVFFTSIHSHRIPCEVDIQRHVGVVLRQQAQRLVPVQGSEHFDTRGGGDRLGAKGNVLANARETSLTDTLCRVVFFLWYRTTSRHPDLVLRPQGPPHPDLECTDTELYVALALPTALRHGRMSAPVLFARSYAVNPSPAGLTWLAAGKIRIPAVYFNPRNSLHQPGTCVPMAGILRLPDQGSSCGHLTEGPAAVT